jgi:hypothetical protein
LSHLKLRKSEAAKQSDDKYFVVAEVSKLRQKNHDRKITQQNHDNKIVTTKSWQQNHGSKMTTKP